MWKVAAILDSVSPGLTMYVVFRTGAADTFFEAGRGGVIPLIGTIKDCPTRSTFWLPRSLASANWAMLVPYFLAMAPIVSPFRTTCSRIKTRLLAGREVICWLNLSA